MMTLLARATVSVVVNRLHPTASKVGRPTKNLLRHRTIPIARAKREIRRFKEHLVALYHYETEGLKLRECQKESSRDIRNEPITTDDVASLQKDTRRLRLTYSSAGLLPLTICAVAVIMAIDFQGTVPDAVAKALLLLGPISGIILLIQIDDSFESCWADTGWTFDGLTLFRSSKENRLFQNANNEELILLAGSIQELDLAALGIGDFLRALDNQGRKITMLEVHFWIALGNFEMTRAELRKAHRELDAIKSTQSP